MENNLFISDEFYSDRRIKYIRKLPGGDNVCLFYLWLICEAARCDLDGFVRDNISDREYTVQDFSDNSGFDTSDVAFALETLELLGLIFVKKATGFCDILVKVNGQGELWRYDWSGDNG